MDIIRLSNGTHHNKAKQIKYTIPTAATGKRIVDDTMFHPISETIKKLQSGVQMSAQELAAYDYPDGKATSKEVPFERTQEAKQDITILSKDIKKKMEKAKEEIETEKARIQRQKEREERHRIIEEGRRKQ